MFKAGIKMADTFSEAKAIIVELLGVDEKMIAPHSRFLEDLGADSLDLVELIMAFEDKFGAEISDEDAQKITTLGDAVQYIDRRLGRIGSVTAQRSYSPPSQVKPKPQSKAPSPAQQAIPQPRRTNALVDLEALRRNVATPDTVFISYSRSDWDTYVKPLIETLYSHGILVWVDQFLLQGGKNWQDEINLALEVCRRMILCVSERSLNSKYVKEEYRYFYRHNKLLIPIMCEPTKLLPDLESIQCVNYKDTNQLLMLLR
jgi:acyl carrier protein